MLSKLAIQSYTVVAAGIVASGKEQDAGKMLIRFISSPEVGTGYEGQRYCTALTQKKPTHEPTLRPRPKKFSPKPDMSRIKIWMRRSGTLGYHMFERIPPNGSVNEAAFNWLSMKERRLANCHPGLAWKKFS